MESRSEKDRTTVPPRLSELQRFILAAVVTEGEQWVSRSAEVLRRDALQKAVVREFGEYRREDAPDSAAERWNQAPITPAGSAALSRSLARLENRGLIERERSPFSERTTRVALTDDGRAIGEEILRQHRDGRYALEFNTLE